MTFIPSEKPKNGEGQITGCVITWEDLPRICASFAVYGSSLGFGSGIAALGASIPQLARGLGVAETSTGQFFTYRGVGVMFGACVSAKLLESPNSYLSKPFICCLGILVAGLALGLVPVVADAFPGTAMDLVKFLFALEGASFGVVESYSAVAISEMWGQRQQPWMQAKNLMSGSGAIVAPVLISYFGYEMAYILIGCIGFLSVVGLAVENMVVFTSFRKIDENDSDQIRLLRKETFRSLRSSPIAHQGLHSESSNFDCGSALGFVDDVALQADELDVISGSLHVINENEELDEPEVRHNIIGDILESKDLKIPRLESVDGEEFASRNRTLSYATPQILEQMNGKTETFNITLLSPLVRFLLGFFASWHIGLLYSYGGWVGTYVILSGIDGSKHQGSEAAALFVTTIFYTFQTIGSIYSVPASVFFSTTALMRFQLTLLVISTLLLIFAFSPYTFTALSSGFMGLALSCIYPLALTVVNDYGATMDSSSTVAVILGGCIGEAIFPAVAGIIIASFGPIGFIWYTAVASVVMVTCYVVLHISFQYKQQGSSRAIDLESVSLIPKIKEILEYVEPMSTLDRIRSRSVSVVDYRTERARSLSVVREVADKFEEYKSYGAIN